MNYDEYLEVKGQKRIISCDKCKCEFSLNSVDIKKSDVERDGNDQYLKILYFICPQCKTVYPITIEDGRYIALQNDFLNTQHRLRKVIKRSGGDEWAVKRLQDMCGVKLRKMDEYQRNLKRIFSGTFTYVTSENNDKDRIIYHE